MQQLKDHPQPPPPDDPDFESASGLEIDPEDLRPKAWVPPPRSRVLLASGIVSLLLLMVFLPPLISVNRFRRQIAGSIAASLGRPVHMDSVTLTVLPMPGFTLNNFVVSEDPAFGAEPVIRAESVQVTLRVWSLWRRRIEFSRIALTDPSVNLVHGADGRWNVESILLQASKIEAAPTAQATASDAPRFPYIEATGARVNLKMGLEKMPLALTEAELALWLPEPQHWRLRLEGHPTRTDAPPTDTGTVRLQGTLGHAATLQQLPIDLTAEWHNAPLGGVSWVLLGRDAGFRGELNETATIKGTVGENSIASQLTFNGLRRSDFVPGRPFEAEIGCNANAMTLFHAFRGVDCTWATGEVVKGVPAGLHVHGDLPDVLQPQTAQFRLTGLLAATQLLDAMRVASSRISPALTTTGWMTADVECCAEDGARSSSPEGAFKIPDATLAFGSAKPVLDAPIDAELTHNKLTFAPVPLNLGAPQPAILTGESDERGYQLRLTGPVLRSDLLAFGKALPQFGDGLESALPEAKDEPEVDAAPEAPIRVDLTATRSWFGGQTWTSAAAKPVSAKRSARRHR